MLLGRESVAEFLSRREPTYHVGRWAARNLPAAARLIGQDHRGSTSRATTRWSWPIAAGPGWAAAANRPDEIVASLRESGFTHVMFCPPVPETAVEFDPTLGRLLAPWLAGRTPLFREDLADGDGVVRRYSIYELSDDRLSSRQRSRLAA